MTRPVVYVVDDDESLRIAVSRLLSAEGYDVRTYASAGEFLVTRPGTGPGCLVLDLHMPGPSGLDLQQALDQYSIALPIVFLTGRGDVASSVRAMKAGAADFLTKPVEPEVLIEAVAAALARDQTLLARRDTATQAKARYATLTERERSVFAGVVAGRLNKQIAGDLGIAERTVKFHRAEVMAKMNVGSVAQLARLADLLECGHTPPGAADPPR
jgi:FixJ family two-component response regulator